MEIKFVDLKKQYQSIKSEIDQAISDVIVKTAFIKGEYVEDFEKKFSKSYGVKHVISCANGTDALYISLKALNISAGDEVITTASSWISTSETITQAGCKVVFVDIEPDSYTIDPVEIERKITKRTKAIIPVHLYGNPANMSKIMKIASKHGIYVIEDCAQAHFATWDDKNVGTFGDAGTFSFYPGKNLGAYGDAGCIITNDDEFAYRARIYSNHGQTKKHDHMIEGINSRMDGIQAAVLTVKLNYIDKWTQLRIQHAKYYNKIFKNISEIKTPIINDRAKHVFHLYVVRVRDREKLIHYLRDRNIQTALHYPTPLPFLKAYKYLKHSRDDFPIVDSYANKILSLPIFPEMNKNEIEFIVDSIYEFYKGS